ncbi:MAG: hypothetical protein J7M18_07160 [Candidatus Eremiobacteraeota bacterium]|nr:hypothetical protein [Candidatus Eremiobacteraeota bacterium]
MIKKAIGIFLFLLFCTGLRVPAYGHEHHYGHEHGDVHMQHEHSHDHGGHFGRQYDAHTGDEQKNSVTGQLHGHKHVHSPEMEFFHQEYFNEPWRLDKTIYILKKRNMILAVVFVILLAISAVPGIIGKRKRGKRHEEKG